MNRPVRFAAAVMAALLAGSATAKPVAYDPPAETASLAPGPDVDIVVAACIGCHSVDYVTTQPRKLADPRAFWTAEVAKMRNVYGAQIADDDGRKIVDYLVATYADAAK